MAAASLWKGKDLPGAFAGSSRPRDSTAAHYTDLDPVITYRHLHSHSLGVRDPLRVIALCDSDAFYAACERIRLGLPMDAPVVVQQWDSLIAVSYPARKYDISRMDKIWDAKRKFPDVIAVHVATYKEGEKEPGYWDKPDSRTHKVSLDLYRRESTKVIGMFQEVLPEGEIEKASIDEAFIDFTRPVRNAILERLPYLRTVPPDAPLGADSPLPPPPPIIWNEEHGTLVPLQPSHQDNNGGSGEDDDGSENGRYDEDDAKTTWHDVALSIAAEMMNRIRGDIKKKTGYTTTAGIARNKFLAKLVASYKKPDNQTILRNLAIPNYLKPMRFQKIRFLGGKLGAALAEEYDVSIIGDMLSVSLEEMQRKFGEESIWVYEVLRGIDRREVKEKAVLTKSMLASKNLQNPVVHASEGPHWIRVLAAELALRLRESREANPGLWPKTIVLHVRQGYASSRSKQAAFPFVKDATIDIIAAAGDKLWKELVSTADPKVPLKITGLHLAFTGIGTLESGQRNIEGFFQSAPTSNSSAQALAGPARKRSRESDEDQQVDLPDFVEDAEHPSSIDDDSKNRTTTMVGGFVCDICSKTISLPVELCGSDIPEDVREDALAALRSEHADYHVALDLSRSEGFKISAPTSSATRRLPNQESSKAKRRKMKESEGIAKFFTQKPRA